MMRKGTTRDRRLTDEEAERNKKVREQVTAELQDIRRRAQAARPGILLKRLLAKLREERQ